MPNKDAKLQIRLTVVEAGLFDIACNLAGEKKSAVIRRAIQEYTRRYIECEDVEQEVFIIKEQNEKH